ncbi:MAG: uroporphyrinogen decarboxylase family protein [Candidatus Methanomethylophilaceae archaeon]
METSKEIFTSRVTNDTSYRMPIFMRDLTIGLDIIDVKTTDLFIPEYDPRMSADAVIAFQKKTGQDAVVGCIHSAAFVTEQFGGVMKYTDYGIPNVFRHPFENVIDVKGYDAVPKGMSLRAIESYSMVRDRLPDVAVVANVTGPLTKAGVLMGVERLAIALETDIDYVKDVTAKALENTYCILERMDSDGSMDCVWLAAATDNPDLFGCDVYSGFVLENLRDMVARIHRGGYPVVFHPHGVFTKEDNLLMHTVETGIDGFQFAEDNDPSKICDTIGRRCSVLGGTNVVPTLLTGPEEKIRSETRRYIDACKETSYVFMSSCSLHRATPIDNVMIMIDEARKYSLIDQRS